MARIPDLDDLGRRPTPRAARPVVGVRNATAVADAIGDVGGSLERTGGQMLEREDQLSYGAAKAALLKADAEARLEFADDPDFETAEKRYGERMAKARTAAASLIRSKFDRRVFEVDTMTDLSRGSFEVRKMASTKAKARDLGLLASSLEDLKASSRIAQDDATRQAAITSAGELINGAAARGLVDPVNAVELRQKWSGEYAHGQILGAIDRGDIEGARGLLGTFGRYLDDKTYYSLNDALTDEADAQVVMAAATAGMGKPLVEGSDDIPAIVARLFPGARITDTDRDPNSALGKANPRSHHNVRPGKGTKAIDVAPLEGITFEEYVAGLKAAGVDVVEARDEVKNPSKHATGPHWHVAYRTRPTEKPDTLEAAISRGVAALGPAATTKQIDQTRAEIAKRWQVMEASEADRENDAVENVQEALLKNGGNWLALPASMRRSVSAKYVPGLMSFAKSLQPAEPKIETNPVEYVRLTEMAVRDPKGFAAINPITYRGSFDDGDWEGLVKTRNEILGKVEKPVGPTPLQTVRAITSPLLAARGLTLTGMAAKTDDDKIERSNMASRIYRFEKTILSDIAIWQGNNPGKTPTAADIQDMADRRMLQFVVAGEDDPVLQFELKGRRGSIAIPNRDVDRIQARAMARLGRRLSKEELSFTYQNEARLGTGAR